jgi:Protein of unknown function (DUF1706)
MSETTQTMTRAEFLDRLSSSWNEWQALLAEVGEARMTEPGVGTWSVKDVIAHVTWGEREMVRVLRARALVGSDLWNVSQDERNAAVYRENRERSLADVRDEAARVHGELAALVAALDDADLNEASLYGQMPDEWVPWELFAGNTFDHYPDHIRDIRAWLDIRANSGAAAG